MTGPATDSIRVALVGFGYVGRVFHAPLIVATPGLVLTVVGSSQADHVTDLHPGVSVVADPFDAVRDERVDLVVLATPNDSHVPLAEAALRAHKHVVVDKPFTITLAEARGLAATALATQRLVSVFQNRRWDSDFLGIAAAIGSGQIGEVVELRSEISRWRPQVRARWRERPGPGSGLWYDLGPHLVDQALVLFGLPETVQADLRIQRHGGSTIDWFHAVLGYGWRQVVLASSMLAADAATRFLIRGTTGAVIKRGVDGQEQQLLAGERPGSDGWGRDPDPVRVMDGTTSAISERPTPPGNYLRYYAAMRDAIRGQGSPPVTRAQATAVMAVIEAGLHSSADECVVRPDYTDEERQAFPG